MPSRLVRDDLNDIGAAIVWADQLASEEGVAGAVRNDLQVCLEEALANLILHGKAEGDKAIRLELDFAGQGVAAIISDNCAPFDVSAIEALDFDPDRIGGAGLRLIRGFTSALEYQSRDGRNTLTMRFGAPPCSRTELLRRIGVFAELPEAALTDLFAAESERSYQAGDKIMNQGDASDFAIVLLSGDVSIINESSHGSFPVARLPAPALLGEIGALADLPRTASVIAATPVQTLRIERAKLREAFCHAPEMLLSVIGQLGQQIKSVNAALGLYASGFQALEGGPVDETLAADLRQPNPELKNFAVAFERLAKHIAKERQSRADLESAALIQTQMLPHDVRGLVPTVRCDIYGFMKPAKDVGGDLYDILKIDDDRIAICIGDVCGKGVPASLFMCITVTLLRLATGESGPVADMMQKVNARLYEQNPTSMFTTLFYGVFDLRSGRLDYVNCGHNPPFHVSAAGGAKPLAAGGPPLGIMPNLRWQARTTKLKPGDALFAYTDGVTEAMDADGVEYGETRLAEILPSTKARGAKHWVEAVVADVERFAEGVEQSDDVTCVAIIRPHKS